MKLQLLYSFAFLWLACVASHAALSPEVYWKVKLPNTPMPKVIKELLPKADDGVRELIQDNTKTNEKVYSSLHQPFGVFAWNHAAKDNEIRDLKQEHTVKEEKVYSGLHQPFGVFAWNHAAKENEIRDLKQEDTVKEEKVYSGLHQPFGVFAWNHAATDNEIRDVKQEIPATTENKVQEVNDHEDKYLYKPYFLEKDLVKGKVINFPTLRNKNKAPFLPRQFVDSIPFSSNKISEILNHFSIDNKSKDAQKIEETIKVCEEPEVKGEKKSCVTSLESMVDFSLSMLETNNILAISTEIQGGTEMLQKYSIEDVQQVADGNNVVCHKLGYAYAVHYCHVGGSTKTFLVSMVGADGSKVKAVSVCHKDTSFWNPQGLPFVLLKVKPGSTPICHYLQDDQIVYVPSKDVTKQSDK